MSNELLLQLASAIFASLNAPKGGKLGSKSKNFPAFNGGSAAAKVQKQIKKGAKVGTFTEQPDKKLAYQSSVVKGLLAKGLKQTEIELNGTGTKGVQTYKGWLKLGRQVKKGQKGVKGCFHYSQTEAMADVTEANAAAIAAFEAKKTAIGDVNPQFSDAGLRVSYSDADLHVA